MIRRDKALGLCLLTGGCSMLVVIFIPWWGFIVAFALAVLGIFFLLKNKGC